MSFNTTFILTITNSSILCFFCNDLLLLWSLLETNTISFTALQLFESVKKALQAKKGMISYFLVQSIASAAVIFSILSRFSSFLRKKLMPLIGISAVLIKIAAAPFYAWFIKVVKLLAWKLNLVLFTWQKLIPICLLIFQRKKFLWVTITLSALAGGFFLINKKSLKEIIGFSSVFNLSWIMSASILEIRIVLLFLVIYWIALYLFIKFLISLTNFNFKQASLTEKILLILRVLNLVGAPPLALFSAKWAIIVKLEIIGIKVGPTVLLLISTLYFYIYLRLSSRYYFLVTRKHQKRKKEIRKVHNLIILYLILARFTMMGLLQLCIPYEFFIQLF